jgi:glycosyltransferase involved in cell wall biosynthesis
VQKKFLFLNYQHQFSHFLCHHIEELRNFGEVVHYEVDNLRGRGLKKFSRKNPYAFISELRSLIILIKKEKPQLIITITPKLGFYTSIIKSIYFFKKNLTHIHWFTGQVWCNYGFPKKLIFKNIDKLTLLFSEYILCDSYAQMEYLVEVERFNLKKIRVIYHGSICGVDEQLILKKSRHLGTNILKIGIVGRLNEDKGIDWLLNFHANFIEKISFELHFYGTIDDKKKFQKYLQYFHKNSDTIFYYGEVKVITDIYPNIDILLLPSYREGFSNVLIEAQASGCPVIARDIYAIKTSLQENITGLLFHDEYSLYCAIRKLKNRKTYNEFSHKAIRFIQEKFKRKEVLTQIVKFYNKPV